MADRSISGGTVHEAPADLNEKIIQNPRVLETWESLTPLARNEWICWVISVKSDKTRNEHVRRVAKELSEGKSRPCCWIGCIHRTDKALSPSIRGILLKSNKRRNK